MGRGYRKVVVPAGPSAGMRGAATMEVPGEFPSRGPDEVCALVRNPDGSQVEAVYVGSDTKRAADLMAAGFRIQLDSEDQVAILIEELQDRAERAKEAYERGDRMIGKFDLCDIYLPNSNIFCEHSRGIPRNKMPQLKGIPVPGSEAEERLRQINDERAKENKEPKKEVDFTEEFVDHLKSKYPDISEEAGARPASELKATQNQLKGDHVGGMMHSLEHGYEGDSAEQVLENLSAGGIIVTEDGYILDGHHRWAALAGHSMKGEDVEMEVRVLRGIPIDLLVSEANDFLRDKVATKASTDREGDQRALQAYEELLEKDALPDPMPEGFVPPRRVSPEEDVENYKNQFGQEKYEARMLEVERRNERAMQLAESPQEEAVLSYLRTDNPHWAQTEARHHQSDSSYASYSDIRKIVEPLFGEQETRDVLGGLVARGVIEEREGARGGREYVLSPELARL